jgi:hypothetical protein
VRLHAAVFVRRKGAFGLGHVGWGFETGAGEWCVGSVENHEHWPIAPPGRTGYWLSLTADPLAAVVPHGYNAYKLLDVTAPDVERALAAARRVGTQPYVLPGGNCMNRVYAVLRAYGLALPSPHRHWLPNRWFDAIAAEARPITVPLSATQTPLAPGPAPAGSA